MGDIIDKAQENDELFRRTSLEKHFARRISPSPQSSPHKGEEVIKRMCLDCKEPIPAKRLKANPAATRCVECQELTEKKGNRTDE
jgi:DnaK suppressor protein